MNGSSLGLVGQVSVFCGYLIVTTVHTAYADPTKSVGGTLSNQETNSNIAFPGDACGVGFGLATFLEKCRMRRFAIVSAFKS